MLPCGKHPQTHLREIEFIKKFKAKYPKAKIGLVVAMTSLRESLKHVFRKIPGLSPSMVINPSGSFKAEYDLLIVDEAHRLRQYKNISWREAFKLNNEKLGLGNNGNELDWILANSKNQIFFYDSAQSVKPSDVDASHFNSLLDEKNTLKLELISQMRVQGGTNYIQFVHDLLHPKSDYRGQYEGESYELLLFNSFKDLYTELLKKEDQHQLCRLVSGYSWEWLSKNDPDAIDIEIEGLEFQWNQTDKDWINNPKDINNPLKEIGCIHTVQGYDLNYTGVIFGKEINYDPKSKEIVIDSSSYFDKYGRIGVSPEELKAYIINIYKTLMYRGIKGTYVYAYNRELREYLKQHIRTFRREFPFRILRSEEVKPYVNSIPLVDISAAAGNFSELQSPEDLTWIEPPFHISAREGYFVCKVVGESMNKRIPNGSYCLFEQDQGGSRNGKIVLVESTSINDSEFGSGYTVKEYNSIKNESGDVWEHESIILKPLSTMSDYPNITLAADELTSFRVVGIFQTLSH